MYVINAMINQTNFKDSHGIFQDSSNNILDDHKPQTQADCLRYRQQSNKVNCNTHYKRYKLSIVFKILILWVIIRSLFGYTSHNGIISINNNKFNICETMFSELYLEQRLYDNDSSLSSIILIRSIVSVFCDINVSNLHIFIAIDDTKCTDKLKVLLVGIKSNTSYFLITVHYVILIRNSHNINFNSISNYFIGNNNNNTSIGNCNNNDKNHITRVHPYYNNDEFVEGSIIYISISSRKCLNYQNILFLRLIVIINMVIKGNSGNSNYDVNPHESFVIDNISVLNLDDEITSMYLDVDYFINELIDYNRALFRVKIYIQYGDTEINIFELLSHSYSVNLISSDKMILNTMVMIIIAITRTNSRESLLIESINYKYHTLCSNVCFARSNIIKINSCFNLTISIFISISSIGSDGDYVSVGITVEDNNNKDNIYCN